MLRSKYEIGHCYAMPENCGQCKNDHFNTQFFHTLAGRCTRLPGQSGQSELITAHVYAEWYLYA